MKKRIFGTVLFVLCCLVLFFVAGGCSTFKAIGHNPNGKELTKIERLPNYQNKEFQNLDSSGVDFNKVSWTELLKTMFNRPENIRPSKTLPCVKTDLKARFAIPTVIWFGHSSFLLKTPSINILVDPDFSGYAGPNSWFVKAFDGSNIYQVKDLPPIDVLLISHDHYDHLDYQTIKELRTKVKHVIVPVGIGSHFRYWGYDPARVHELNWNQTFDISPTIRITVTPARHESGRSFATKKTLWASFVIETDGLKLFYSGDSAYGRHFKEIGSQYGPFDLAMLECGQYNKLWPRNHMFPEQTALAASDLKAKVILPVHWAKFAEAEHPWNESVNRLLPAARKLDIPVTIPEIGEPYSIGAPPIQNNWFNP